MNKKILELKNISLSFDNKKTYVLKDINFSLYKGEILSIIGINGSGKSTLLKIIAQIYKQNFGEIKRNYKNMAYVPQKISLDSTFPIMVKEFIKIYNSKVSDSQIKEYLDKFNSIYLFDKNISDLSGGEFQKILIVSSLISKPDLILLDEPTTGIDIVGEEKFYEIIKEVKELFPEISIILVSHNLKLVYKNSDKVMCLHDNNFCCHGSPLEVGQNKITQSIFGKYTASYKHSPHAKNSHKK